MSTIQTVNRIDRTRESKGGGKCCLYGCLTVAIVMIVLLVGGYYGLKHFLTTMTQDSAVVLPQVEMSQDELDEVRSKWDAFFASAEKGDVARIELTSREVNALIANDPDWQQLKGQVYLDFSQSEVNGMISVDLSDFGAIVKDRYLNGQGVFDVSCVNGRLKIFLKDLTIAGKPLPASVMEGVRATDLAEGIYTDTDADSREMVEKLKRVKKLEFQSDLMIIEVQ